MVERVVIIDYGSGNLRSVEKAFERAAQNLGGAFSISVSADAEIIASVDRVVLPGVGAFGACMAGLRARDGVMDALHMSVFEHARPFLGVCVGMQLLANEGREMGHHRGLGWIDGVVDKIHTDDPRLRVPHMGWNEITVTNPHPVLDGLGGAGFYYANSYCVSAMASSSVRAVSTYGHDITAAVGRDNIFGVQFHPEKSQDAGQVLIENFLKWRP